MAYSDWKLERQLTLEEKKTAWKVLEAFPTFKAKMKVKEKFSVRLIRRTYKWLIKVNKTVKEKNKFTISDFMHFGTQGCNIFMEDAFEIRDVVIPTGEVRNKQKIPSEFKRKFTDDENYFSDSEGGDTSSSDDESSSEESTDMHEQLSKLKSAFEELGTQLSDMGSPNKSRRGSALQEFGDSFGGAFGGMMQGLMSGMFGKDKPVYAMQKEKYEKLKDYLDENRDSIAEEKLKVYEKMLKLLKSTVDSYDEYDTDPVTHAQVLEVYTKRLELLSEPYPPEIPFNEEMYSQAVLESMFSGQTKESGDCKSM